MNGKKKRLTEGEVGRQYSDLVFDSSTRAENRTRWKNVVAKSTTLQNMG